MNESTPQDLAPEYDEDGNLIPIVQITSLNDDLNDEELYSSLNMPNSEMIDLESFKNHQEELFEMQRKQLERLKERENNISAVKMNVNNINACNQEHSLTSIINQVSSTVSSSSPTSISTTIPQPSTLDPASVQFALRAVVDTVF